MLGQPRSHAMWRSNERERASVKQQVRTCTGVASSSFRWGRPRHSLQRSSPRRMLALAHAPARLLLRRALPRPRRAAMSAASSDAAPPPAPKAKKGAFTAEALFAYGEGVTPPVRVPPALLSSLSRLTMHRRAADAGRHRRQPECAPRARRPTPAAASLTPPRAQAMRRLRAMLRKWLSAPAPPGCALSALLCLLYP